MKHHLLSLIRFFILAMLFMHCGKTLIKKVGMEEEEAPQTRRASDSSVLLNLINGSEWRFGSGRSRPLPDGSVSLALYAEQSVDPCHQPPAKMAGFWLDTLNPSATEIAVGGASKGYFSYYPDDSPDNKVNALATSFKVSRLIFTADRITGILTADNGESFHVESAFDVPRCGSY